MLTLCYLMMLHILIPSYLHPTTLEMRHRGKCYRKPGRSRACPHWGHSGPTLADGYHIPAAKPGPLLRLPGQLINMEEELLAGEWCGAAHQSDNGTGANHMPTQEETQTSSNWLLYYQCWHLRLSKWLQVNTSVNNKPVSLATFLLHCWRCFFFSVEISLCQ